MQSVIKRGAFLATRTRLTVPRCFFSNGPLKEKEVANEKLFFDKEESIDQGKTLEKLLKKLQNQNEVEGVQTASSRSNEQKQLQALFAKYKISAPSALVDEILDWKLEQSD